MNTQQIEKYKKWRYRKGSSRLEALEISHENYHILYKPESIDVQLGVYLIGLDQIY
jgi:hypothetical protein